MVTTTAAVGPGHLLFHSASELAGGRADSGHNIKFNNKTITPQKFLTFLRKNLLPTTALRFAPYEAEVVTKESVGVINLMLNANEGPCFVLGRRTERARDLRGLYALPTGTIETVNPAKGISAPSAADIEAIAALAQLGLIKTSEAKPDPSRETLLMAATRENREESGLALNLVTDCIGRIEFQGMKPFVRVVGLIADATRYSFSHLRSDGQGELDQFQLVPVQVLLDATESQAGPAVEAYLQQQIPEVSLMQGLLLRGMEQLAGWLKAQLAQM